LRGRSTVAASAGVGALHGFGLRRGGGSVVPLLSLHPPVMHHRCGGPIGWSVPLVGIRMPEFICAPVVAVVTGRLLVGGGDGQVDPRLSQSLPGSCWASLALIGRHRASASSCSCGVLSTSLPCSLATALTPVEGQRCSVGAPVFAVGGCGDC
jgi:hypothetical protein